MIFDRLWPLLFLFILFGVRPTGADARVPSGSCPPILLQLTSGMGSSCAANVPYTPATSVPGLTYAGSVSGTGATVRTATDAEGVVHAFANGAIRITDNGTLIESAVTNLLIQSQTFTNAAWTTYNATLTANATTAPDGSSTATLFSSSGSQYEPGVYLTSLVTASPSTLYTVSCYAKVNTDTYATLYGADSFGGNAAYAEFNLTGAGKVDFASAFGTFAGLAPPKGNIQQLGSGWYRISLTFITASGTTTLTPQLYVGKYAQYPVTTSGYFWGCQMETGGLSTSYIPTTSAQVTRSADTLTLTHSLGASNATVYLTNGVPQTEPGASIVDATSPVNLGGTSGGYWVGNYVNRVTVTTGTTVPPAAAAAGYNTLTFSSANFSAANVDTTLSYSSGFQWYCVNIFAGPPSSNNCNGYVSFPGDGSMKIQGAIGSNSTVASAGSIVSAPTYVGNAFGGGGYFDAVVKFNPATINTGDGWPTFWGFTLEYYLGTAQWPGQATGYTNNFELDTFEAFSNSPTTVYGTLHNWYGQYNVQCAGECNYSSPSQSLTPTMQGLDFNQYHHYSALWIPATATRNGSITFYFDGIAQGYPFIYSKFTSQAPPPDNQPWAWGVVDGQHIYLLLGAGTSSAMTVKSISVWQTNSSSNLHN